MSIETHLIALNINGDSVAYFKSFGDEHIPKEVEKITGKKNIKTNINRIQANDLIMPEQFSIGFIDFMLKSETCQIIKFNFS